MCYQPSCPICEMVWFGSGLAFWTIDCPIVSVDRWAVEILCGSLAKELTVELIGSILQLCWAIWKARN